MSWFRHEYRDKRSGELIGVEIEPAADLRPHRSDKDCDCVPWLEREGDTLKLIHNAFDGRESCEPDNKEKGY